MHIIFGKEQAQALSNKYTVLELDTVKIGDTGSIVTAYCPVETIPIEELAFLEWTKATHQNLMVNYSAKNWQDCLSALAQLKGKWRGELDTFYQDLESRVQDYIKNPPSSDWSPVIVK
jgi:hypothetical protein